MVEFFQYIRDVGQTLHNALMNTGSYFDSFFVWLNVWWMGAKLKGSIYFLKIAYLTAVTLLNEIGFNTLFSDLFNRLPSELRFYAFAFKVPEGFSLWMNCATTSLVMRMSR